MLLKYFYDSALAHASYMVGCQRTNEAIIIDPGRDISPYLEAAQKEGMRLVGAAETHIHADYVSGARELAVRVGATLYVSDEGPADWKYLYAAEYPAKLLKDGDTFNVGFLELETMHTPGHTPESISFILTDVGGGANRPMGVFTGDFVFVGATGRPDLLEKAAGVKGNAVEGALQMFDSLERFKALPDYLQVWPAHGAGSACGKGLGAIPSTTVGYEKLFNPALAYEDKELFVEYLLADQPEAPKYFAVMKRVNKEGPALMGDAPLKALNVADVKTLIEGGALVIDTASEAAFAASHVPGSINVPTKYLANWAGWFVNYDEPLYLITTAYEAAEAGRIVREIGVDTLVGYFNAQAIAEAGLNHSSYAVSTPEDVADSIANGDAIVIDVRAETEWNEGHIPEAKHYFLGRLQERAAELVNGKTVIVQCRTGGRSAIGASILKAAGAKEVVNMAGGILAWQAANLPIQTKAA